MSSYQRDCDIYQGFQFKVGVRATVGHITRLTLAGKELTADLSVKDPLAPATTLAAVAVLSGCSWAGRAADPIYLMGQVSAANRKKLAKHLAAGPGAAAIGLIFAVYDYDSLEQRYYKGLCPQSALLSGHLADDGMSLTISDEADHGISSPINYAFTIGAAPTTDTQLLALRSSVKQGLTVIWCA